jgi:aspartate kinase
MTIVIMKFGGSCLKDENAFRKILKIIEIYREESKIFIASALNGITDLLLSTAQNVNDPKIMDKNMALIEKRHFDIIEQVFEEDSVSYMNTKKWVDEWLSKLEDTFGDIKEFGLEANYQDYILSFGEMLSTYILNQYLQSKGLESIFIPSTEIIITNDDFNNAYPLYNLTNERMKRLLIPLLENPKEKPIICVTGFIGRNKIGNITTLGRGGSDYTATIIAHSLYEVGHDKNIRVILWKDVDGLFTINPKYASKSSLIKQLDYIEAKHVANFGAKILHPKCLEAIEKDKIPLELRNFEKPFEEINYTRISEKSDKEQIKGISAEEEAMLITVSSGSLVDVPGVLATIFKVMKKNNISVSLVAQTASEVSTSFIIKKKDAQKAITSLKSEEFFSQFFDIKSEIVAMINITGVKVLDNKTKIKIFQALDKQNIYIKAMAQGTEELNISLVLKKEDIFNAMNLIHDSLCEDIEKNNTNCKSK